MDILDERKTTPEGEVLKNTGRYSREVREVFLGRETARGTPKTSLYSFVHSIGIPRQQLFFLISRVSSSVSFGASSPFLVSLVFYLGCLCDFEVCACLSLSLLCAFVFGDGVRETKKDFATLCSSSSSSSSSRRVEHCLSLSPSLRTRRKCTQFAFELINWTL